MKVSMTELLDGADFSKLGKPRVGLCSGITRHGDCENDATEPHVCPYREDIENNSETLCDCCEHCQSVCEADI